MFPCFTHSVLKSFPRLGEDLLSTWTKSKAYQRDFSTVASESFIDPALHSSMIDSHLEHTFKLSKEVVRAQHESKIAEKVEKIALGNLFTRFFTDLVTHSLANS